MLCWLAVQAERSSIERDLERRSRAALAVFGYDWASVAFDGRDGLLVGNPRRSSDLEDAAELVRKVWGVRVVRTREQQTAIARKIPAIADVALRTAVTSNMSPTAVSDAVPADVTNLSATVPVMPQRKPATDTSATATAVSEHSPVAAVDVAVHSAHEVKASTAPVVATREVDGTETAPSSSPAAQVASKEQPAVLPQQKAAEAAQLPAAEAATKVESPAAGGANAVAAAAPLPEQKPPAAEPAETLPPPKIPEHKPAVTTVPPETTAKPDIKAQAEPVPVPDKKPSVAGSQPSHETTAPAPSDPPSRKPAEVAVAPTTQVGAKSSPAAVLSPERKPVPAFASETSPVPAASVPTGNRVTAPAAPKPPTTPPRFETAALPPGNIAADATCISDVQGAAKRVQVHFARGAARLDTPGKALIDGLVTSLNACPGASLHISGHADASGKARHNKALSERRARSVAAYMVDKGIDAGRLIAVGYGDKKPVAPNDTRANRARNRRIELAITVRSVPLPPMPVRKQGTRNGLSHR